MTLLTSGIRDHFIFIFLSDKFNFDPSYSIYCASSKFTNYTNPDKLSAQISYNFLFINFC